MTFKKKKKERVKRRKPFFGGAFWPLHTDAWMSIGRTSDITCVVWGDCTFLHTFIRPDPGPRCNHVPQSAFPSPNFCECSSLPFLPQTQHCALCYGSKTSFAEDLGSDSESWKGWGEEDGLCKCWLLPQSWTRCPCQMATFLFLVSGWMETFCASPLRLWFWDRVFFKKPLKVYTC